MIKLIRWFKDYFYPPYSQNKNVIKGHKKLKKQKKEKFIKQIKNDLSNLKVFSTNDQSSIFEIQVRQFLISRLLGISFEKEMLSHIGSKNSFLYPLPATWRSQLKNYNISVSFFSGTYFKLFCIAWFIFGFISSFSLFYESVKNSFIIPVQSYKNYSFFSNLYDINFSNHKKKSLINNFIDDGHIQRAEAIIIDNRNVVRLENYDHDIKYLRFPFLDRKSLFDHIEIGIKFAALFFYAIYLALIGRIYYLLMFKFLTEDLFAKKSFQKNCPNFLFFHNTDYCFKPLWVYSAEKFGACSVLYYYSSNIISFDEYHHVGISIMNWNKILVWSIDQKKYLERAMQLKTNLEIHSPLNFFYYESDQNPQSYFHKEKKNILIFDVQPQRPLALSCLGFENNYYSYENSKKFINEIILLSKNNEFHLIIKRKRNTILADKRYLNLIKNNSLDSRITEADPLHAPEDLIPYADLVISMPYTSTALVARHLKKPSVFYDATGSLTDSLYNDIEIISSQSSLESWMIDAVNNSDN